VTVIKRLGVAGFADNARVIVEKPFSRDLASTLELNHGTRLVFPEESIFRIDHFLGKEAIMNIAGPLGVRGNGSAHRVGWRLA
jgi:glucose-6-phosphate 1-dehydrogenase